MDKRSVFAMLWHVDKRYC